MNKKDGTGKTTGGYNGDILKRWMGIGHRRATGIGFYY
jgi:hypothetical protein